MRITALFGVAAGALSKGFASTAVAFGEPGPDRGFVFQQDNLLPWRRVLANVEIGPEIGG